MHRQRVVFFPLTAFHLFLAQHLARSSFSDSYCYLILDAAAGLEPVASLWEDVIELSTMRYVYWGRNARKMSDESFSKVRSLIRGLSEVPNITMFLANIHHPIHNRIFFDPVIARSVRYYLLADGVGSYVDTRLACKRLAADLFRWGAGLTGLGPRFHPYFGAYLGQDQRRVRGVFGLCANHLACEPEKRRQVNIVARGPSLTRELGQQSCLFLGQPLAKLVKGGGANADAVQKKVIAHLLNLRFSEYLYRPHRDETASECNRFLEAGFRLLPGHGNCIEERISSICSGTVASFASSALFNLQCLYGQELTCLAFLDDLIPVAKVSFVAHLRRFVVFLRLLALP